MICTLLLSLTVCSVAAFPNMGKGMGMGMGMGMGPGGSGSEMDTIQNLLMHHSSIKRVYNTTADGIQGLTTSSDPQVAQWIKQHVAEMKALLENGGVIRMCDPLFEKLFQHRSELRLQVDNTTQGVATREWATTSCGAELVKAHAAVVSRFVEYGPQEAMRCNPHEPPSCA